jgi:hypothetical protein
MLILLGKVLPLQAISAFFSLDRLTRQMSVDTPRAARKQTSPDFAFGPLADIGRAAKTVRIVW